MQARRFTLAFSLLTIAGCCAAPFAAGQAAAMPQTARQALLEMFFSKTPGTLVKHLPAATLAALGESGAMANLNQYALLGGQLEHQQKNLRTFETGSVLLSAENTTTASKMEVVVENDNLRGEQDDIELSFQAYKNGALEHTPYMPQMTFSMKQELGIWKLNEISVTVHLPLADPDLLKTLVAAAKLRTAQGGATAGMEATSQTAGGTAVLSAMRTIVNAEKTYAATYRDVGFTCTLSELDGFGGGERNQHQAMLINAGLAGGKRFGYLFALSQCAGSPASSFTLTASPNASSFGQRAYCTDQSGMIRYSADGSAASCLKSGTPVQ